VRLDKWLKVSRLIKRRTVAQMACDQHRVFINDKIAKSATVIKPGDKVHLELGSRAITASVLIVPKGAVPAQDASKLYEITEEIRRAPEVLEWLAEHEKLAATSDDNEDDD
jgi:ribosomal 50S subunit-recycling heat shock protein